MQITEQKLDNINLILVDYLKTFRLLEVEAIPCFDSFTNIYEGILAVLDRRNLLNQTTYNILDNYYKNNYNDLNELYKQDLVNNPNEVDLPIELNIDKYSQLKKSAVIVNPVSIVSSSSSRC